MTKIDTKYLKEKLSLSQQVWILKGKDSFSIPVRMVQYYQYFNFNRANHREENKMIKVHYSVGTEVDFEDSIEIKTKFDLSDLEWIAEDCAKDYENNYDGWEDSWPIEMILYSTDGKVLGKFEVEKEDHPAFSASHKENGDVD